jgi:cytochrome b subunit of formate dehydrogenase
VQQKIVFYFVVGIVAMVLVGGFVIWLIYKAQEKNLKNNLVVADAFNSVANKIVGGGNTPS